MGKLAAGVGSPQVQRLLKIRDQAFRKDTEDRDRLAKEARIAFVKLIKAIDNPNLPDRELVKFLWADSMVEAFLQKYIGDDIKGRHQTTIYAVRDALNGKTPLKVLSEKIEQQISKAYFSDSELYKQRKVLTNAIGDDFLDFFPSNMVIDLDPKGQLKVLTERFENQKETLDVKHQRMVDLLEVLSKLKTDVEADLRGSAFGSTRQVVALVVAVLLDTGIRPSSEANGVWMDPATGDTLKSDKARARVPDAIFTKTHGATDLEVQHITDQGSKMLLDFKGKMGGMNKAVVHTPLTVKVLRSYLETAVSDGALRVFRTANGATLPESVLDAYCKKYNFRPTDLRKLRASEQLFDTLKTDVAQLYAEIRTYSDGDDLRQHVVKSIRAYVIRALESSRDALSHDDIKTTIKNYLNPVVMLRFLSTGQVGSTFGNTILMGDTEIKFDPRVFLRAAREFLQGKKLGTSFEAVRKAAPRDAATPEIGTIRVASLGDLSGFLRLSSDLLVHKSSKDLWSVSKTADGFTVNRLFDDDGKPIKA